MKRFTGIVLGVLFLFWCQCGFAQNTRVFPVSGDGQVVLENSSATVLLKVVGSASHPLPGFRLHLFPTFGPKEAHDFCFEPPVLVSDEEGLATVTLRTGPPGEYRVMAQAADNPQQIVMLSVTALDSSWIMYLVFGLLGGLGMFLFGMNLGADGLQKIAGKRMKAILGTFTENKYLGVLTGIVVTAITQSSSATTVMLVGFVNAQLMTLAQTLSVIMGANVGTTITVQLIAFDISHYALFLIGIGFVLKNSRNKTTSYAGDITLGFGLIFYGMKVMSVAMAPLRSIPAFRELLLAISHYPLTAIVGSMLFTSLIQSSGATIGLLVVFAGQNLLDLHSAIPLILGAHIGTCITGWIAAMGGSTEAKQTAMLNVVYNVVGTLIFLPFLSDRLNFGELVLVTSAPFGATPARLVANAHMISAVLKVVVLMPFYSQIVSLTNWILPPDPKADEHTHRVKYLSDGLLSTPELALGNVAREISRMSGHVEFMVNSVPQLISYGDEGLIDQVFQKEQKVDFLMASITRYLSNLSEASLTEEQTDTMMRYMNIINHLEGLGDNVQKIIVPFSKRKKDQEYRFSEAGYRELLRMFDEVNAIFMQTINAFATNNLAHAQKVIESEGHISRLETDLRDSHMKRIFDHQADSLQTSTLHLDLLSCFLGIHARCVKIARAMLPPVAKTSERPLPGNPPAQDSPQEPPAQS